MAQCKYHPLSHATFACDHCAIAHCDHCIGSANRHGHTLCHFCDRPMDSLGTGGDAEPFWRRLQAAFRYPLNSNALTVIISLSIASTLLSALPLIGLLTLFIYLSIIGAMLKYAFKCMEATAAGEMTAPAMNDAYQGGAALALKLLTIIFLATTAIITAGIYVSYGFATFLGTVFVMSFPAVLIRFAQSDEIFDALNPLNALKLILAIGLPYGVLIALIMVMMGSVGVIQEIIGDNFSILSGALQSVVSNYYLVVAFHIMGYMLYQYQDKLGFTARADNLNIQRSPEERLAAKIDVNVKEGYYSKVVELLEEAVKQFPKNKTFAQKYFDFACNTRNKPIIEFATNHWLNLLNTHREYEKLNIGFTTAVRLIPSFIPNNPEVRLQLAKICYTKGDPNRATKLLNGLHKSHPQFNALPEAYELMATALEDLKLNVQASKFRQLTVKLQQHPKSKATTTENPFAAREIAQPQAPTPKSLDLEPSLPEPEIETEPKELPPIDFK